MFGHEFYQIANIHSKRLHKHASPMIILQVKVLYGVVTGSITSPYEIIQQCLTVKDTLLKLTHYSNFQLTNHRKVDLRILFFEQITKLLSVPIEEIYCAFAVKSNPPFRVIVVFCS